MNSQVKNFKLPESVAQNLKSIKNMGVGHIAEMINLRAGRMPEFKVKAKRIIDQFNLIESELLEGKKAAINGDVTQVRDAIADIILLAAGQQSVIAGIDVVEDYRLMCAYNMTRIPQSMEEAIATTNKYSELGIETYIDEVEVEGKMLYPVKTIAAREQTDYNGEHYAPNKFLKSVNFVDAAYPSVDFVEILGLEDEKAKNAVGNRFTAEHAQAISDLLDNSDDLVDMEGLVDAEELKAAIKNIIGERF